VFYDPAPIGLTYKDIASAASELPIPISLGGSRLVVHIQTAPEAIDEFLGLVRKLAEEKKNAGFVKPAEMGAPSSGSGNIYQDVHVRVHDGVFSE
jgi:threonine aldolase